MNQEWKLLAIMASVFLIGFFLEETIIPSELNHTQSLDETFEIISELFSVFVALSIFAITWFAYNKSRDNHSLFLGTTFLITGLLILCHLLSYPFMPDFINPNSSHKAAIFFLESRFILAFLLLASVYVHKDSLPKLINKYVLILFTIAILSVCLVSIFFHENFLFMAFDLNSYSTATVFLLLVISIIILAAGYLYKKRAKETFHNNLNYFAYGSIVVLFSNLVYFSYELSGHFLIITGFFYFYLAMYRSSVELPYEKLAIAEEKLRKGVENKYSTLFDNANDAIITTDLEYQVTSWNRSAVKLFGWEAHEVMGKKLSSLIVPLNLQTQGEGIIHDTVDGKSAFGIETVKIRKDGSSIFVSLTTSQLLDSNHNLSGLSFMIRDITERKKAEDLLNRSKEFAETVINSMNDAIAVIDIKNFMITEVNSVFLKNCGMTKKEVIGKTCYDITHNRTEPCTPPDDICPLLDTLNTGKYSTVEHEHNMKSGEKRYVEVSTSPIIDENRKVVNVIHVSRDITERKQVEKALHASEEKFEKAFRSSPQALTITDLNDGRFIEVNDSFTDTLGYSREEAIGHTTLELGIWITDEDRTRFVGALKRDGFVHNAELDIKTKMGDTASMLISAELIDVAGKACMLSTFYDITQRKFGEEEIRRSLEEKEVLLREIHHRVKNNMQIVSSLLILQSENIEDKKYKDIFIESQNRILSMALIHEKLYQSRSLAQINFKEYIEGIVSNIFESYGLKSNIKIDTNVENVSIKIEYAVPCGLIINELVTNSIKYAFPERRQGKIQISVKSNDINMIQISISDDGIGIPTDMDIRKTKSLGLHLVTALAENQLHGEIILNREKGTEFQINFKGAK